MTPASPPQAMSSTVPPRAAARTRVESAQYDVVQPRVAVVVRLERANKAARLGCAVTTAMRRKGAGLATQPGVNFPIFPKMEKGRLRLRPF